MKKRGIILYTIIILFTLIASFKLIDICILKKDDYKKQYDAIINKKISFPNSPRGRILDVNGKVLVDNIGVNTLIYNKMTGSKDKDEINIARQIAHIIEIEQSKIKESMIKNFYMLTLKDSNILLSEEELKLFKERKLSSADIKALKLSRITGEIISKIDDNEKKASYIYHIMNKGYNYQDKTIKKGLTDEELAKISDLELPGIRCELTWERTYPYGNVLKSIFGSVSQNGIPLELLTYYKEKDISLDSQVGTSYLELQYDDYLRGTDAIYEIGDDGTLVCVQPKIPGNDLYLSIDIDLQLKIEEILKEEIINAKAAKNSKYYNHSYIILGNPETGEIRAMAGLMIIEDHFMDITSNIISSSYTVGSIVKGATISVGYANNLINPGEKVTDSCIKVYGVTEKCSWKKLGKIDDISALAYSSNYFQFLIATRLTNPNYKWNSHLYSNSSHFEIYRNMLKSYGLGTITGIDLPGEKIGIIGTKESDDLLLNLTIGQYDTYTPIEVFQYINTLANDGHRTSPSLMKKIVKPNGETLIENKVEIINTVNLSSEHLKRIQEGFSKVMTYGTGKNYTDRSFTSAGKTGTSETFVDSNKDGVMDTKTISTSFIMYAPYENPKYSIVIMSPNIAVAESEKTYKYSINLKVNQKITKYLFEND